MGNNAFSRECDRVRRCWHHLFVVLKLPVCARPHFFFVEVILAGAVPTRGSATTTRQCPCHPPLYRANSTTQHNTTQHNTARHNQKRKAQHNTANRNTTQRSAVQRSKTQHSTTQHNTTPHNTTRHNTTAHSLRGMTPEIQRALYMCIRRRGTRCSRLRYKSALVKRYLPKVKSMK